MQLDGRQGPLCLGAGWQNQLRAGRINSLGMSHCPTGTVPLLYRVIQLVSRLAKTPETRSLVSSAESGTRYPTVSYPIPVFRYLAG
jgi:hypothetical protein